MSYDEPSDEDKKRAFDEAHEDVFEERMSRIQDPELGEAFAQVRLGEYRQRFELASSQFDAAEEAANHELAAELYAPMVLARRALKGARSGIS